MKQIIDRLDELDVPAHVKDGVITLLSAPRDIKLIYRLQEPEIHPPQGGLKKVIFMDSETTGVNATEDELIELGYIVAEFTNTGELLRIVKIFDELNQPRLPILNSDIHGITNEMVEGKQINFEEVHEDLKQANLVVAHNAGFDRKVVERYVESFATIPWACTFKDINWKARGIGSHKLDYLAYSCNFFFEAHRAAIDAYAMFEIVKQLGLFKELLLAAITPKYIVSAQGSPFGKKDALKERGYKPLYVGGKFITWYTSVSAEDLEPEKNWLLTEGGCRNVPVREIGSLDRYSVRENF